MATQAKKASQPRKPSAGPRPAVEPVWLATAVHVVVVAAALLVMLVFTNAINDIYTLPKASALYLAAVVLVGVVAWSFASSGVLRITTSRTAAVLGAIVLVMALATALGAQPERSLFGEYGRDAGLLTYLAAAVLFVAVVTHSDPGRLRNLALGLAAGAAVVVAYGGLQVAGAEPFQVPPDLGIASTLGQRNFMGAFAGLALPLFLWIILDRTHQAWLRIAAGLTVALTLVVGVKSLSFQSYGATVAGAAVVLVAWGLERFGGRIVLFAVAGLTVVGLLVGLGLHDKIETQVRDGLNERVLMWQAGRDMVKDRPVLGYGPSGYALEFSEHRPLAHLRYGIYSIVDVPHDVPLGMFVAGGLPLGLLYLGFVGLVGLAFVRGLRRTSGSRRLLLGAFGGVWLAYQVQSLVSIDVPTLVVLHLITAGAIVVLADGPPTRTFSVPSLVGPYQRGHRLVTSAGRAIQVGAVVVGLVLTWWAVVRPLSADAAYRKGLDARASNDLPLAVDQLDSATSRTPSVGPYWPALAGALAASGDQDRALIAGKRAADVNPSALSYALGTAQFAARMGQKALAEQYFAEAVRRGRQIPDVYRARADYWLTVPEPAKAIKDLRQVVRLLPNSVGDWLGLADTLSRLGYSSEKLKAYERVLELDPTNPSAVAVLAEARR